MPSKKQSKTPSIYTTTFDDISLQGDRAQQFMITLTDLCDANDSLATVASLFPHQAMSRGELQASCTTEAFTGLMRQHLSLLLSMASGEDHIDYPSKENKQGEVA